MGDRLGIPGAVGFLLTRACRKPPPFAAGALRGLGGLARELVLVARVRLVGRAGVVAACCPAASLRRAEAWCGSERGSCLLRGLPLGSGGPLRVGR